MTTRLLPGDLPVLPQEMTDDELIGERVHQQMFRSRVTQTWMASRLGMQQSALSRKLRGQRPWLAAEVLLAARVLGVDAAVLLPDVTRTTEPNPPSSPFPAGPQTPGVAENGDRLTHQYVEREQGGVVLRPQFRPSPAAVVASATTAVGDREAS